MNMAGVMSLLLIALEMIILLTLIKLEFKLNAYSISLKKIMGYTMWQRYVKLAILSLLALILGGGVVMAVGFFVLSLPIMDGLVIMLLLFVFEWLVIQAEINKVEKFNIPRVLKGEFR